jgi:hypothetical protein
MEATTVFEIRNNLIGVPWKFDDAEKDYTIKDIKSFHRFHLNDGIYIYLISKDKIIQKVILKCKGFARGAYYKPYFAMGDKLILGTFDYIFVYKLNTFETMFKLSSNNLSSCNIYPFNEKNFILFQREGSKAKFILYNINTMKSIQTIEVSAKDNELDLFPISNNEYIFNNLIITIDEV